MRKKAIIISAIVITVLILLLGIKQVAGKKSVSYKSVPVKKRTIIESVEAAGTINPVQTVDIGTQVSGTIKEIYVDYNSEVKKGDLLAQIDPALFQAQVDKARSDLNAAKANYQRSKSMLEYEKKNYERYARLYTKNYVSKSEVDLAEANYKSNLAEVNAMRAQINQASATLENNLTNLRYTKIISPVDGVVVSRSVDVGQTVAASFQTPTLFMVAQDLTQMQIEVNVSEADIGRIKVGQDVTYTLDGYNNQEFHGKVSQVRISPTTVSNVVTYTVIVDVSNDDNILIPGMTANVSVITNKSEDVVSVPVAAFRFTQKEITGGKKFEKQGVWIVGKNKKPQRVEIVAGASDGDYTAIKQGEIKEGDRVIVGSSNDKQQTAQRRPMRMF